MSLLNSFFRMQPIPFVKGKVLVNLKGNESFESSRIFPAGKYKVELQAGAPAISASQYMVNSVAGRVLEEFSVEQDFIVRAYCGSNAKSATTAGVNPYVGEFKKNGLNTWGSDVDSVSHIFGNAGSACSMQTGRGREIYPSSGNCLGDGVVGSNTSYTCATGAGSCMHIIPLGGSFGQDYLRCFHATSGACGANVAGIVSIGGSGSCYGGAGSACSNNLTQSSRSYSGGSTPYGQGGAGKPVPSTNPSWTAGDNGTGIGAGFGGGRTQSGYYTPGSACWFDGTDWHTVNTLGGIGEDGKIVLTFLGALD